ncbi:MAG: DNA-deoxyinosine glycosylase [Woeseia sp.]
MTGRKVDLMARGFPPIAAASARVLILGSLPGQRSIDACEYYAHPRNAFWPVIEQLFGIPAAAPYALRVNSLKECGVALWDVLHASQRRGSLDSAIDTAAAEANGIAAFVDAHQQLRLVGFNGQKAAQLYRKLVVPDLREPQPDTVTLPSTSPAHAAMPFARKLDHWRIVQVNAARKQTEGSHSPKGPAAGVTGAPRGPLHT